MYLSELTVAATVHSLVTRMALNALKRRDISKIDRMFEGLAGLVARLTFPFCQGTQIDRMLERRRLRRGTGIRRVSQNGVTNVAVVSDYFAGVTYVFAVVTTKTTGGVEVADVIGVCLPIRLHLREEVGLEGSLHFSDCGFDGCILV